MKISFHGACGEVTGSCILIKTGKVNFLVDCGFFQGLDSYEKNLEEFNFNPSEIDFVLLTHAHLDHCGRLPKLVKEGFSGKIISTAATRDLAEIILQDSSRIFCSQEKEPIFNFEDVKATIALFENYEIGETLEINGIKIKIKNAGHILGSSIYEVWIAGKKIVFSGDLGNENAPIMKEVEFVKDADVLVVESTYGGKEHSKREIGVRKVLEAIKRVTFKKSILLIPVFSIERTQELLFELNNFKENNLISKDIKVFLDSPLAIKATNIYKNYKYLFDDDSISLIRQGDDIFNFKGFKNSKTIRQSLNIEKETNPKIILAGAGMCSGGRMPRHLKKYLGDKDNELLLISYQSEGTLGRRIQEGEKKVLIGESVVNIKARLECLNSFSSHADSKKLINWIKTVNPKKIFINHGDLDQQILLKEALSKYTCVIVEKNKEYLL